VSRLTPTLTVRVSATVKNRVEIWIGCKIGMQTNSHIHIDHSQSHSDSDSSDSDSHSVAINNNTTLWL